MILSEKTEVRRAFIYVFYDAEGIADAYVEKMLSSLREVSSHTLLVVNGDMLPSCREALEKVCDDILVRENSGYDITGYLKGLERLGDLSAYDEIILINSTLYGPFYPLGELFAAMDSRDVDFWGLLAHPEDTTTSIASSRYGYVPRHLQSYFIALRRSLTQSEAFRRYISSLPPIRGYDDARGLFEISFTQDMVNSGFTYDVYADTSRWDRLGINAIMYMPWEMVRDMHFPFAKQKAFSFGSDEMTALFSQRKLLEYLEENSLYDVSMITENLARTQEADDVRSMSGLSFVVDSSPLEAKPTSLRSVFFIDPGEDGTLCADIAELIPEGCRVYINHEDILSGEGLLIDNVRKALAENPHLLDAADLVCMLDLSRFPDIPRGWDGGMFLGMCRENMMASKGYVARAEKLFEKPLRLGWLDGPKLHGGTHTVVWPESDEELRRYCFWARKEVFLRVLGGESVKQALKNERMLLGRVMSDTFAGREEASYEYFASRYGGARKRYLNTKKTVKKLLPSRAVGYLIKLFKKIGRFQS